MAQIQQFDLGKAFDTGRKMNQAINYYDDRNMAIEDRQRGIDKENYGFQRQAEQDQLKQEQFTQKKKQAAQKDLELYITHTNPEDPKFMDNSKKFLGYFKDKYSDIDDDIERFEQMPEEELKMFVGNLRSQAGLDTALKTEQQTIYGPDGETKRVAVEKGKDYTPPKGWSLSKPKGSGMKVYDSQGNLIVDTGGGEMSKKTKGSLEGDVMNSYDTLHQLEEVKSAYQDEFLTYSGKAKGWWNKISEKAGSELSEEDKKFIGNKKKFDQRVNTFFNAYRKLITGAAASVQELADLKKAVINTDLSPTEFKSAYDDLVQGSQRAIRVKRKLLRDGVSQGTKDWGKRFDNLYMSGGDDVVDERAAELQEKNPEATPQDIAKMLMSEGYQ